MKPMIVLRSLALLALVLLAGPLLVVACGHVSLGGDWRTADRSPSGLAPDPTAHHEAVVLVFAARAFNWRGAFAVHTWLATKAAGASGYTVHQVLGWRRWRGLPVLATSTDVPDRNWFGNRPRIIAQLRGARAERAIATIEQAEKSYPYPDDYVIWPGPNSNTFTAYVARAVPALHLAMPANAVGKDYLGSGLALAPAPSGTGYQLSLHGLLGILVAREEGFELNLLGLTFGIDPLGPAIKLPGFGRVGFDLFHYESARGAGNPEAKTGS